MDLVGAGGESPLPKVRCPVPEATVLLSSEFFLSIPSNHPPFNSGVPTVDQARHWTWGGPCVPLLPDAAQGPRSALV